jgi:hypothetical protein
MNIINFIIFLIKDIFGKFFRFISLLITPLLFCAFGLLVWPFYYIRNEWREWNYDSTERDS